MNRNKKGQVGHNQPRKKSNGSKAQGKAASSGLVRTMVGAAVSSSIRSTYSFGPGSKPGSLRMNYRVPLVQLGNDGTAGLGILRPDGFYCSSVGVHADCIDNQNTVFNYWQSPAVNLIAESFSRYKNLGLTLEYCPQSTTVVADRLVLGFSSDPDHPLLFPSTTTTELLALSDSVPFAPWNEFRMPVHVDSTEKYIASVSSTALDTTERRLTAMGILGCTALTSVTAPAVYGVLYATGSVEFLDLNPLVVVTGTPSYLRRRLKATQSFAPKQPIDHSSSSSSATPRPPPEVKSGRWVSL